MWNPWKALPELDRALRRISLSMGELYDTAWVANEVARCAGMWNDCAAGPASIEARYSLRDQVSREIAYDAAMHEVEWEARRLTRHAGDPKAAEQRLIASFARFAQNALDIEPDQVSLLTDGFLPAGIEFARRARQFDPAIGRGDTMQACRNAWTACGLQPLMGTPSRITQSILAYSLLYPYSDNYLDAPDVPAAAKLAFSGRFRQRLEGHTAPPANRREDAIWRLVAMIEQEFARSEFPGVYMCLLGIHRAQEESVAQLRNASWLDPAELLRLSLAKGGTSVLADACLARGAMTTAESRVAFEWGALLQLGDDLQDVADDLRRGSQTLFTNAVKQGETLDGLVLQLFRFCACVSDRMTRLPHGSPCLKDLLRMSWTSLIFGAVASGHEFFSPEFLRQAEQCSPFRFQFLRARQRRLGRHQGLYANIFDQLVKSPHSSFVSVRDDIAQAGACAQFAL